MICRRCFGEVILLSRLALIPRKLSFGRRVKFHEINIWQTISRLCGKCCELQYCYTITFDVVWQWIFFMINGAWTQNSPDGTILIVQSILGGRLYVKIQSGKIAPSWQTKWIKMELIPRLLANDWQNLLFISTWTRPKAGVASQQLVPREVRIEYDYCVPGHLYSRPAFPPMRLVITIRLTGGSLLSRTLVDPGIYVRLD